MTQNSKSKILMVVDGNSLIHRGFHAIPHLSTSKGYPSNGVYGFVLIFLNAIKLIKPDYVAVAFDVSGPTFRDKIFKDYKAKRVKAPQELYDQIPKVKEFVQSLNLPIFEKQGFEGDDIIGTLVKHVDLSPTLSLRGEGVRRVIVTGDLDSLQLVDESTSVFTTKKGLSEIIEYDDKAVQERFGFGPEYVVDYKALRGDPSDNIPGVAGIGEKGAIDLIKKFGHIEELYKALESDPSTHSTTAQGGEQSRTTSSGRKASQLSVKLRQKLLDHKADALLSKKLATIDTQVKFPFDLEKTKFGTYDAKKALEFLREMEFKSLFDKLPRPLLRSDESQSYAGQAEIVSDNSKLELNKKYHLVDTQEKLDKLVKELKQQKGFAVDTETTSQKEVEADLLGISVSFKKSEAYYVPISHNSTRPPLILRGGGKENDPSLIKRGKGELDFSEFIKVLEDKKIEKYGHNMKYDYLVLNLAGINLQPLTFDTMIAAYLLNPGGRAYGLDQLAFNHFGYQMLPIEALIGKGKGQKTLAEVPLEHVSQYSCEDADYTFRLKEKLEPEIKKEGLEKVFYDIDQPLVPVLGLMEKNGVILDSEVLKNLNERVEKSLDELETKIHKLAKKKFNIASPLQLKEILFTKLAISTVDIKKTKTGLSTAASELEKMKDKHPIIPAILEYRELSKLKNTYLDALPVLVSKKTGRLHTSYSSTIAATGRLSSNDPNLQNIPIRSELGNKIREAFVAPKGFKILSCDYSQIELRVIAHLAKDSAMVKVFKSGKDIHNATAAEVFGVPEEKVSKAERRYAKVINFGVLYGLSAYGFTQQIPGVTHDQAQAFIDKYFLTYKGVAKYIKEIIAQTKIDGYVCNPLGRKRYLPEINSSQFPIRAGAERAAISTPVQSLAADIIKVAMINIANQIGVENPECKMLLQVHDELVFEIKEDKIKDYAPKVKKIMEEAIELSVPVAVDVSAGESWGQLSSLSL